MREQSSDDGFTLVELLVVMVIIGILAAVAIPILLNQRAKARDTATRADVAVVGKTVLAYFIDGGTAPAVGVSGKSWMVDGKVAGAVSDGVRIVATYTGSAVNTTTAASVDTTGWTSAGWCLALTNDGGSTRTFRFSNSRGLEQGQCASATSPL